MADLDGYTSESGKGGKKERKILRGKIAMGMLDVLIARSDQSFARFNVKVCRHSPFFAVM